MMEWLRTDCFVFKQQMPDYIEEQHLMVMGHRDDNRVYYAYCPIPEHLSDRPETYKQLYAKFMSYLKDSATTNPYTPIDYALLLERTIRKYKAFVLDTFPDGQ